jgi:uncharacterized membrane protein YqiK
MKSNYDVETYAEAFDRHNDFTGAIHPEGLAAEFRGICEDADKEIASHATEVTRLGEANDAQEKLLKEAVATSRAQAENFVKMKRRAETAEAERDAAVAAKERAEEALREGRDRLAGVIALADIAADKAADAIEAADALADAIQHASDLHEVADFLRDRIEGLREYLGEPWRIQFDDFNAAVKEMANRRIAFDELYECTEYTSRVDMVKESAKAYQEARHG